MREQVCWQFLKKKEKELEHQGFRPVNNAQHVNICPINYHQAREFILQYEWIGNMGTSKYCFGLFLDGHLGGVVCYGPLVAPSYYKKLLGNKISANIMQLCRGASTYWAPSKLISKTLRILNLDFGIKIVIAYADEEAGEIGIVYQACNAYYIGMTSNGGAKRYIIRGHLYDPRKVYKKFGSRAQSHLIKIDPDYTTRLIQSKHRYMFILGNKQTRKNILQKIDHLIQPYPKRILI